MNRFFRGMERFGKRFSARHTGGTMPDTSGEDRSRLHPSAAHFRRRFRNRLDKWNH